MKKIFIIVCTFVLGIFLFAQSTFASEEKDNLYYNNLEIISTSKTNNNDGSYYVIRVYEENKRDDDDDNIITDFKIYEFYDSDDTLLWEFRLIAQFEVIPGVSVACVYSNYVNFIYQSGWSFENGESHYSGAYAYASGTFKKKVMFITIDTRNVNLSLYCDIHGNVS